MKVHQDRSSPGCLVGLRLELPLLRLNAFPKAIDLREDSGTLERRVDALLPVPLVLGVQAGDGGQFLLNLFEHLLDVFPLGYQLSHRGLLRQSSWRRS